MLARMVRHSPSRPRVNVPRALLNVTGMCFALAALLYNPITLNLLVRFVRAYMGRSWMETRAAGPILASELAFAIIAALCFATSWVIGRSTTLDRFFRRGGVEKVSLALLVGLVPFTVLELSLRPFSNHLNKGTWLFVSDAALGWKLRPSTTQPWGGVDVTTNAHGLRGPEIPYARSKNTRRIVYLGDSVTFGYMVARWEDTFPYVIESRLRREQWEVETVNSGVGGYSPWQELTWLRDEGLRYAPDLVVLGFVLNDVTEKFTLVRYGGAAESRQLRDSFHSWKEHILGHSALVYQTRKLVREFKARRKLGRDLRLGAIQQERVNVQTLIHEPESEGVQLAWNVTLESLQEIADLCAGQEIELIIAMFPFTMQFNLPNAAAPQKRLAGWADDRGITTVDLLPALEDSMATSGSEITDYFIDDDHLTIEGHRVASAILLEAIREKLR